MDREQHELQFLGFLGVYRETTKIILKWRTIFAQIMLVLILPLCVVSLAAFEVLQLLTFKIDFDLDNAWKYSPRYRDLSRMIKKEWIAFCLYELGYFIFVFIFSLLSTLAVVYTVACIYAAKQITFKKIMSVVPRVWKRLMVTFFWCFAPFFVYNVVAVGLLIAWLVTVWQFAVCPALGIAVAVILLILSIVGFVYIAMIWLMASVISVLEDAYGRKAMVKSRRLIKGKMGLWVWCFLGVLVWSVLVQAFFESLLVLGLPPIGVTIGVGLICLMLLLMLTLFNLVVQTVIYFVCKSYHHENIDSFCLSDHLEGRLGDRPSEGQKAVQLEQLHV
ncbi:hypothetical protein ACJRO7_033868 [Eucalyptus globulus]|uniref:Uncharacterized protein n=1 Tax=Eucalyptus globulus TaxID=34317 RepID=A0ABD3J4N3_EUCGL